jgi:hypothetical protein
MTRTGRAGVGALAMVAVVATVSCKQKVQASADAIDSSLVVSLERGPCRGRCPVYRVDLYGDGKVHFDGKQYVGRLGTQSGTTAASAVQELLRNIRASEFTTVDSAFVMGSAACGQYHPDLPMSKLSAKLGTQMKTVQHDPGCRNAPRFLRTLEAQVDSVARTAQWIAGNGDAAK